jgi:hypothetical protein
MSNVGVVPEKLADYERNPAYERRVVIFYDVLGWRSHIGWAGTNPGRIGDLRRLILQHSRTMRLRTHLEVRVSTFSDNVVITQAVSEKTWMLVAQMALFQVASAINGFLLRGGITIGPVVHDDEAVFGPALNRAYELESQIAKFPRFVLDPACIAELGNLGDLRIEEDGVHFLDPFRLEFIEYIKRGELAVSGDALRAAGLPFTKPSAMDFGNDQVLELMLHSLKPQIKAPLTDKDWEKIAWLYDRLADQLGVPPARSYPRVRPANA